MIRSMTGFGSATVEYQQKTISAEIKSVNSKFFDLILRLPVAYREKEMDLRAELARLIERGKVEVTFTIESQDAIRKGSINVPLVKAYYEEFRKIESELKISTPNYLQLILTLPDVMMSEKIIVSDGEWTALSRVLDHAIKAFQKFRLDEGKVMDKDLRERVKAILTGIKDLSKFEDARIENMRRRLNSGLEEFIQSNNIDRNRFEQEIIFYIEKLDLSEEKVRLKSHCDYFLLTMNEDNASGKKLNFISQEIGREINTIGSKANDADIQKIVVIMKDELEKIKEQLLNVL